MFGSILSKAQQALVNKACKEKEDSERALREAQLYADSVTSYGMGVDTATGIDATMANTYNIPTATGTAWLNPTTYTYTINVNECIYSRKLIETYATSSSVYVA